MTILPNLPPNLTQAQLQEVLNDRIRELNQLLADLLTNPMTRDLDMGSHRILALNDPQGDLDGVNLRTLKRFQSPAAPAPPPVAAASPAGQYTMVFDKTAALVDGELVPAFTVGKDRSKAPEEAWLYSQLPAPDSGKSVTRPTNNSGGTQTIELGVALNFAVWMPPYPKNADGTPQVTILLVNKRPDAVSGKLNPLDLLLPAGQRGPVFFQDGGPVKAGGNPIVSGFAITKPFPHGTIVYPLIDTGSGATLCSMGLVVH